VSRETENLTTWFILVAGFLTLMAFAGNSMDFQDRCEAACGKAGAITPLVNFEETCFCNSGGGRWDRVQIND